MPATALPVSVSQTTNVLSSCPPAVITYFSLGEKEIELIETLWSFMRYLRSRVSKSQIITSACRVREHLPRSPYEWPDHWRCTCQNERSWSHWYRYHGPESWLTYEEKPLSARYHMAHHQSGAQRKDDMFVVGVQHKTIRHLPWAVRSQTYRGIQAQPPVTIPSP